MNKQQRQIASLALLIGGPLVGLYWSWINRFYFADLLYPLIWTIATVAGGLLVRAGGTSR